MFNFLTDVNNPMTEIKTLLEKIEVIPAVHAIIYFFIGFIITLIARWFVGKVTERHVSRHHSMLFKRFTFYIGLTLSLIFPLKASGIDVTALLGAAGILTAAVAFAAQTSISNFLSGVFLVAEKPFEIGDFVKVNDLLGEVLSIDLLSVKIRTRDNLLVRIPNESLLKSQFCNVSRFPIRRFDMKLRVAFDENLEKVKKILLDTALQNPLCLVSPAPEFMFLKYIEYGIQLQFSVWGKQSTYSELQTCFQMDVQKNLKEQGVQLPVSTTP
jgi:small-conductance mechanosensitive channel